MSTASITILVDQDGKEIAVILRHADGYPEGHGVELARLLAGVPITQGLPLDRTVKVFNGANDMAAAIVAGLKDGPGGIYLYPAGTRDLYQSYTYTVHVTMNGSISIEITDYDGKVFHGYPDELLHKYAPTKVYPDWDVDALAGTFA